MSTEVGPMQIFYLTGKRRNEGSGRVGNLEHAFRLKTDKKRRITHFADKPITGHQAGSLGMEVGKEKSIANGISGVIEDCRSFKMIACCSLPVSAQVKNLK